MFIDNVTIFVKGGTGGRGCKSMYRDKYSRRGVCDGGDGGRGADIIVKADRNLSTLLDFRYNKHFYGTGGAHGLGKNKKGGDAAPVVIRVPVGTLIKDLKTGCILRDLDKDADQVIVAVGGKGGQGNKSTHQVASQKPGVWIPLAKATDGEPGEERELVFDLKLIADIGVVGFPNVGKSTLISAISNAHPEIAAYPFTTKFPVLGVIKSVRSPLIIADIPGLIEGSSSGKGLGDKFLRHIERTKVILHLVDMAGFEGRDPVESYTAINEELKKYSKEVSKKPQIIAANKMDLEGAENNLKKFKKIIKKKVYPISALKKEGLEELIEAVSEKL